VKIFITGGTGFIGRYVINYALSQGLEVVALRRPNGRSDAISAPRLQWIEAEMDEVHQSAFAGCQALIHLAAHGVVSGMNDWAACFHVNVHQSLSLWVAAADAGIKRFVISGSCFEYGRSGEHYDFIPVHAPLEPTGAYHSSKAAATVAALGLAVDRKLEIVVLRPFHVYGDGEAEARFWPTLRKAALAGEDFPMTLGGQIRDFIPVDDVAKFFLRGIFLHTDQGRPRILNVGTGKPKSLADFAQECWKNWGAKGALILGQIPYRENEVMRYVPEI